MEVLKINFIYNNIIRPNTSSSSKMPIEAERTALKHKECECVYKEAPLKDIVKLNICNKLPKDYLDFKARLYQSKKTQKNATIMVAGGLAVTLASLAATTPALMVSLLIIGCCVFGRGALMFPGENKMRNAFDEFVGKVRNLDPKTQKQTLDMIESVDKQTACKLKASLKLAQ